MYWIFLKEKLFFVIFFLTLFISNVLSNEVRIEFKVDNEIVTNIDINKEYRYLIALNNNLQTLEKNKIYEIARLSVIKEIVKKNELKKYYDLNQNPDYMEEIIKNFYKGLNINNEEEFEEYLLTHELKISDVKEKLEIEAIWNEFIFTKYKDQVKIDEDKLRKILKEQIDSGSQIQKNYLLSEIFFN